MPSAWESRFAELVQRITASREGGALEVLRDLMPVLPVVDPASPELYKLRGERLLRAGVVRQAAAGQFPTIELANRSAGQVIVIDQLILAGSTEVWFNGTTDSGFTDLGASNKDEPDSRWNGAGHQYAVGAYDSGAATLIEGGVVKNGASTTVIVPVRYVITNGFSLTVQSQTLADRLLCTFSGFIRTVQPDESRGT